MKLISFIIEKESSTPAEIKFSESLAIVLWVSFSRNNLILDFVSILAMTKYPPFAIEGNDLVPDL
ncbi:MAG: hypothetical protein Q8L24_00075 [bacterium]|nr:hypothetical protein [bacterium]